MKKVSKDKIIHQIQDCLDKHGKVNRRIFNEDTEFVSGKTVYNKFGSFSKACEEAQVPHHNKPQQKEKVTVECRNCGKEQHIYPYRLDESTNNRFFCDNECQGEWWSKNVTGESHPLYEGNGDWSNKFGSKWHIIREKRLERDNFQCQFCGMSYDDHVDEYGKGLEVHHITPRRKFYQDENLTIDEANKMENLITLCREHHIQAENGVIEVGK